MNRTIETDVCVIGGGPAGSTIAHQLAVSGHDVVITEALPFPRPHVGATLPGSILPLLDTIGVRERIARAGFLCAAPPLVRWPDGETAGDAELWPGGFHVDRAEFDSILLSHASRSRVKVLQPARAVDVRRTGPSGGWLIVIRNHESVATVRARVLVDASGQGAVSRRRARFSPPLLAMYAYGERHADRCAGPRIEAGDSEWIWFAPLTATRCICAVFLDPKRLAGAKRESMDDLFRRVLTASRSIAEPAAAASLGEIRFRDATSRAALSHAALDMIRVGDASLAIDPLSSQGVQVAIASALQGAVVVNTLLKGGADAQTAVAFYEDRQNERKELHRSRAAAAYGEVARRDGGPFWQERAAGPRHNVDLGAGVPARATGRRLDPTCVVRLSPTVTFENSAAIRGDLVTTVLAVRAPDLPRPVAFVGGIDLAQLLVHTRFDRTAAAISDEWQRGAPGPGSWATLCWLWDRHVVAPAEEVALSASESTRGDGSRPASANGSCASVS